MFFSPIGKIYLAKKIAIVQSSYIPWKGYFDMIRQVDEFILYDDVQYTKRDWRNRNLIRTPQGLRWLTIPVEVKGKFIQKIEDTKVSNHSWAEEHWKKIRYNYASAACFKQYQELLETCYSNCAPLNHLSHINHRFIKLVCGILGIPTKISWSMDYKLHNLKEGKTERLVALCQKAGADFYLSGPRAKDYLVPELFQQVGIELQYMDYSGYPTYQQSFAGFEHGVSIIDLLLNQGPDSTKYMKALPGR